MVYHGLFIIRTIFFLLPFTTQSQFLTILKMKAFENIVIKGENAGNSFPTDDNTSGFCGQCRSRSVWSLIYTVQIFILDYNSNVSSCNGPVFSANEKIQFIYSLLKGLKRFELDSVKRELMASAVWSLINGPRFHSRLQLKSLFILQWTCIFS